jgi:hypothetical protein
MADTEDVLQKLLNAHADKVTGDALTAVGIPPESIIDAAASLLHEHGNGRPTIHHLCPTGIAQLIRIALCAGYELGIRSCAAFRKPH